MDSLLIRNGMIVDAEQGTTCQADLAVKDDRITRIGRGLSGRAVQEIDAAGCLVTPGLIDHHVHLFPMSKIGIPGEAVCFSSGVTTAVDAGSAGCGTYEEAVRPLRGGKLEVKSYVNVCTSGLDSLPEKMEDVRPEKMDEGRLRELFARRKDELLGLKLRTSRSIVRELGFEPLKAAVALGERLGVPLMVHITDPPGPLNTLLSMLRPGDIVTHIYQNTGFTLLKDGVVMEEAYQARKRGILFEAADARAHFSFEVCEQAFREGFFPDFIGTDLTKFSMYQRPTSFSLAMQLSKYTHLGMEFAGVIRRMSWNPAVSMGIADRVGSLAVGKQADIAVFRPWEARNVFGDRPFVDGTGEEREGERLYVPMLTVKKGEMVYRNLLF